MQEVFLIIESWCNLHNQAVNTEKTYARHKKKIFGKDILLSQSVKIEGAILDGCAEIHLIKIGA